MSETVLYQSPRADMLRFLPAGARTVLDVGCSTGGFGRTLRAARPDLAVWGIEPDPVAAAAASEAGYTRIAVGGFPEAASGFSNTGFSNTGFDVIFFNDVLEHMVEPEKALTAAHDLLAPGGHVVASIPNVRHFSVWWPLIRRGEWEYEDTGILDRTHLRFFTPASMRALFDATDWQVLDIQGTNRARWPNSGMDTWKTRTLSRATAGRSDPFFWSQYVVTATSGR